MIDVSCLKISKWGNKCNGCNASSNKAQTAGGWASCCLIATFCGIPVGMSNTLWTMYYYQQTNCRKHNQSKAKAWSRIKLALFSVLVFLLVPWSRITYYQNLLQQSAACIDWGICICTGQKSDVLQFHVPQVRMYPYFKQSRWSPQMQC